jgi:hypothetical protein
VGNPTADRFGVPHKVAVHLSHCNFGENTGHCKYGDRGCPALSEEWSWIGDGIERGRNVELAEQLITDLTSTLRKISKRKR